jgi:endoglycosylceramidase
MMVDMNLRPRRVGTPFAALVVLVSALVVSSLVPASATPSPRAPVPAGRAYGIDEPRDVRHNGRWLIDAQGRVLLLHGVNMVQKTAPYTPEARGFGDDDAQWLKENGFDVVRLGITGTGLMPAPGVIDVAVLDRYAATVDMLARHQLFVVVDLHQDGWGERANGEPLGSDGFPEWMTLTKGALNTHTGFPLYYVTNPAIQQAFQSLWDNEPGPDSVALQQSVAKMFGALATRFADNPWVLGYDVFNEPWPGVNWASCLSPTGCPELEHAYLDPLYAAATSAIRRAGSSQLVLGEPFVLFNFGTSPATFAVPGGDANAGMSFHMYTTSPAQEPALLDQSIAWSQANGGALLNTEWGSTHDPAAITRQADEFDAALMPWMFWAYDEDVVVDMSAAPEGANVRDAVAGALIRPHAVAVAGQPLSMSFNAVNRSFELTWETSSVLHGRFPPHVLTTVNVPRRQYPDGYTVEVRGATVRSDPCAQTLLLANQPGAKSASVRVTPDGTCPPPRAW